MMEGTLESNRKDARIAAALFLFVSIPLSVWSESYVPSKIFVPQDPVATASNLLSREFIFRSAVVVHLFGFIFFVIKTSLLYRIFRPVNTHLALLMLVPIFAQCAITFVMEAFEFAALMVVKSEPRAGFGLAQQQEAAYLLLRINRLGLAADKAVIGLYFIPLGMLIYRSGFMPRIFGVLVIISGIGYVIDTCSYIMLERPIYLMVRPIRFLFLGYFATMLWMLFKGVQEPKTQAA